MVNVNVNGNTGATQVIPSAIMTGSAISAAQVVTETQSRTASVTVSITASKTTLVTTNGTTTDPAPLTSSTSRSNSSFTQNPAVVWGMAGGILGACLFMAIVFIIYRRMRRRTAAEGNVWKRFPSPIPMVERERRSWLRERFRFSGWFKRTSQPVSFQQEMGFVYS
jgi:hypothetical protein